MSVRLAPSKIPLMVITPPAYLRQRAYQAVALTHFLIDILNNSRNLLVALLAKSLDLSNAQVGVALLLYNVGGSLLQPVFGWLADRFGPRWIIIVGTAWMILFYALTALGNDWLALTAITVAGLGSGAFHPSGTTIASRASREHRTQATAVFFMAGQLGLFLGPVLAGLLLDLFDRPGFIALPLLAMSALVLDLAYVGRGHDAPVPARPRPTETAVGTVAVSGVATGSRVDSTGTMAPMAGNPTGRTEGPFPWRLVALLVVIIITMNTLSIGTITFAPKLFVDLGYSARYVGLASGIIMLGSALGGLVGGRLADRIGGKWPVLLGLVGGILPAYFYIPAGDPWRLPLLVLTGFFVGMPHSVLVLLVQSLLPQRQALASGLALGFMFTSGAVGSYLLGVIADRIGLGTTLQQAAFLLVVAGLATLFLPRDRTEPDRTLASP